MKKLTSQDETTSNSFCNIFDEKPEGPAIQILVRNHFHQNQQVEKFYYSWFLEKNFRRGNRQKSVSH